MHPKNSLVIVTTLKIKHRSIGTRPEEAKLHWSGQSSPAGADLDFLKGCTLSFVVLGM